MRLWSIFGCAIIVVLVFHFVYCISKWSAAGLMPAALLFQKSLNISQTSRLYDGMVVYEKHAFSHGIVFQINVSVDIARHYKYVFLVHTDDDKICKRHIRPTFKGMCAFWTGL